MGATLEVPIGLFRLVVSAADGESHGVLHVIPGIDEYLHEFISDEASGEFGYLTDRGLIPLPESERKKVLADVEAMKSLHL